MGCFTVLFFFQKEKMSACCEQCKYCLIIYQKKKRGIKRPGITTEFKTLKSTRRFYDNASLALSEVKKTDLNGFAWIT